MPKLLLCNAGLSGGIFKCPCPKRCNPEPHAGSWYNLTVPIYEYICDECETRFERIVINKQQEISCPKCASKKASIQLSVFATTNGSSNGAAAKPTNSFSGGGSCCGGGCGCH